MLVVPGIVLITALTIYTPVESPNEGVFCHCASPDVKNPYGIVTVVIWPSCPAREGAEPNDLSYPYCFKY